MGLDRWLCNEKHSLLLQMTPAWVPSTHTEHFTTASNSSSMGIQCPLLVSKGTITHVHRHTIMFKEEILKGGGSPSHKNTCSQTQINGRSQSRKHGDEGRTLCPGIVSHSQLVNPPFLVRSLEAQCRFIHALNRLFVHTSCGLAILTP